MAVLDLQEQERLEAFKSWWKDNRAQILGGVLIAAVVVGGWRGWQYYQGKQSNEAAVLYAEFTKQLESIDSKRINASAAALTDKFAATPYAARAALLAARANELGKDSAQAKTQLQWVIAHAAEAGLKDVARLRLASLLLDDKNYADALTLLEAEHPASFVGLYTDLKGDVLSAQGKIEEARAAYQLAIDKTDAKSMYRNLIQVKLDAVVSAKATVSK